MESVAALCLCTIVMMATSLHAEKETVNCGSPGEIENGYVEGSDYTYKAKVTYRCNVGYSPDVSDKGQLKSKCLKTGKWSTQPPTCVIKSCGAPKNIRNGKVEGDAFTYNSNVTYSCDEGYVLNGTRTRTCQHDRTWSDSRPRCKIVQCGIPDDFDFGVIKGLRKKSVFASNITYKCSQDFELMGEPSRTCGADGQWSGKPPVCKSLDACQVEAVQKGKYRACHVYKFESLKNKECKVEPKPGRVIKFTRLEEDEKPCKRIDRHYSFVNDSWVVFRDACPAKFMLCYSYREDPLEGCFTRPLASINNEPTKYTIEKGIKIDLVRLESRSENVGCTTNDFSIIKSKGGVNDTLLVSNGCQGVFSICLENRVITVEEPQVEETDDELL